MLRYLLLRAASLLSDSRFVGPRCALVGCLALVAVAAAAESTAPRDAGSESRGDRAFASRSESHDATRIREAIAAYESALEAEPDDLALRVKLLRALFFHAEYATEDRELRKALYQRGRLLFEDSFHLLALRVGRETLRGVPAQELRALIGHVEPAGPLYFWGAMHWGLWAESFGKVAAVRQGVIKKVRELGEGALALSPEYEGYGPVRVLGRLHHLTPKIPILTRWVDREEAVRLLRRSVTAAPDEPLNPTFLAHALWQLAGDHRAALALLRDVADRQPRASHRIEDRKAIEGARELIRRVERDSAERRARFATPTARRAAARD